MFFIYLIFSSTRGGAGGELESHAFYSIGAFVVYFASLDSPSTEGEGKGSGIPSDTIHFSFFVHSRGG